MKRYKIAFLKEKRDNYLMQLLPFLLLGLLSAMAYAQPEQTPTQVTDPPAWAPRPTEPRAQIEFDVKAFLQTLNSLSLKNPPGNDFDVPAAIEGGRLGFFGLSDWCTRFIQERGETQYRFDKIEIEILEKDAARVRVFYALLSPSFVDAEEGGAVKTEIRALNQIETLNLKFGVAPFYEEKRWRIVPPDQKELLPHELQPLALQFIAYYGSQRPGILSQLRSEISMSHLKRLSLGVFQLVQDYDDRYAFQNECLQEAISPYIGSKDYFLIPGTRLTYTFNNGLSDKNTAEIKTPAQTVLFYEGENEQPTFRYDGKAAIGFADGHVKLVSPKEAKTLIWKP